MYKLFLAWKYFFARAINIMSVLGIAASVWLLTVVPSVMDGFIADTRDLIRGTLSDITVTPVPRLILGGPPSYPSFAEYKKVLEKLPHVESCAPRVSWVALISTAQGNQLLSESQFKGLNVVEIVGLDPKLEKGATKFHEHLANKPLERHASPVADPEQPFALPLEKIGKLYGEQEKLYAKHAILLSEKYFSDLGFEVGQRVVLQTMVFPPGEQNLETRQEVSRKFYVAGSLRTGEVEITAPKVYVSIEAAQELIALSGQDFTEIVVRLDDYQFADETRTAIENGLLEKRLGGRIHTWEEQRGNFLRAVRNETVIVTIMLSFVLLVAAVNIFIILNLIISQKIRDIGVISALGGSPSGIMGVFVGMGALTGLFGELIGGTLGYLTVRYLTEVEYFLRDHLGVQIFDPTIYAFDHLPAVFSWPWFLSLLLGTMIVCVAASLIPAYRASRLKPVEALRYE